MVNEVCFDLLTRIHVLQLSNRGKSVIRYSVKLVFGIQYCRFRFSGISISYFLFPIFLFANSASLRDLKRHGLQGLQGLQCVELGARSMLNLRNSARSAGNIFFLCDSAISLRLCVSDFANFCEICGICIFSFFCA